MDYPTIETHDSKTSVVTRGAMSAAVRDEGFNNAAGYRNGALCGAEFRVPDVSKALKCLTLRGGRRWTGRGLFTGHIVSDQGCDALAAVGCGERSETLAGLCCLSFVRLDSAPSIFVENDIGSWFCLVTWPRAFWASSVGDSPGKCSVGHVG